MDVKSHAIQLASSGDWNKKRITLNTLKVTPKRLNSNLTVSRQFKNWPLDVLELPSEETEKSSKSCKHMYIKRLNLNFYLIEIVV